MFRAAALLGRNRDARTIDPSSVNSLAKDLILGLGLGLLRCFGRVLRLFDLLWEITCSYGTAPGETNFWPPIARRMAWERSSAARDFST